MKHNIRLHMDKGLIAQKVMAYGDMDDPVAIGMDTLKKSVAILDLAVEDFEKIRAGAVTDRNGDVIEQNREDIIFVSEVTEKASRAAERTLNMMAKQALTAKELEIAHNQTLRAIQETINQFVPPDKRQEAFEFAAQKLRGE